MDNTRRVKEQKKSSDISSQVQELSLKLRSAKESEIGALKEELSTLKRREKLLKKAQRALPREKFDELGELYLTTAEDPELVKQTIGCIESLKSPLVAQLLSLVGIFGVDRFYLGDKRSGMTKLFTLGGILVFWFYDIFSIRRRARHNNYINLRKAMGAEVEEFDLDKLNK